MKKSSLKSLTIAPVLSMVTILLVLVSCKSLDPIVVDSQGFSSHGSVRENIDSIFIRDTIYRHDSVIYRERIIHDTVFITKEVYRNASHSTLNAQHSTKSDTIRIIEYQDRVVEKPPERYVPKFYKWTTALLFIFLFILGVRIYIKLKG